MGPTDSKHQACGCWAHLLLVYFFCLLYLPHLSCSLRSFFLILCGEQVTTSHDTSTASSLSLINNTLTVLKRAHIYRLTDFVLNMEESFKQEVLVLLTDIHQPKKSTGPK